MKTQLIILLLLTLTLSGLTQSIPKVPGPLTCTYIPKYTPEQRSKFYPFNISETIKLVSFRYHRNNVPISEKKQLIDSFIETKALSSSEISRLTDIIYNNFYKKDPGYGLATQCFFPRNAILFINKSGKLREYILICFHCNNSELSSSKINLGDPCSQKMEILRNFFIKQGVKFGTDKSITVFPGEDEND